MRRNRIALAALAALVLLMCLDAGANGLGILSDYGQGFESYDTAEGQHYEQVREGSLEGEAANLTALEVRLNLGSAVIRGAEGDCILATYRVRVLAATPEQAAAYAAEIKVGIEEAATGGSATLAVTEPPIRPVYVHEATVDLDLEVPAGVSLLVETYGSSSIQGLASDLTLLGQGTNEVSEVHGDLRVELRHHGSLDARAITGNVSIKTSMLSREVSVRSVGGDVDIDTRGTWGTYVDVQDMRGMLRGHLQGGALRASTVDRGVTLTQTQCDTRLDDIGGPILVCGSGSCTVAGLRNACTADGDALVLRLLLDREAPGFEVQAEVTGGGTVRCDYPLQRRQEGDTTTVSGTIGDGRFPIEVKLEGGGGLTISPDPGT